MIRILLAEDDLALNQVVKTYLEMKGYYVDSFTDGLKAYESFEENKYDMIISDIMMPGIDGFELAKKVRSINKNISILFMTAKDDKLSQALGYTIGIDEYVTKPFDVDVLMLKVQAILRRANINNSSSLEVGNLKMDKSEHMAYIDNCELNLTVREFDILFEMLSYPKKTFTRSRLMEDFWDFDSSATSRTVDVYMAKLRDKTKDCTGFDIVTVHGLGYKVVLR